MTEYTPPPQIQIGLLLALFGTYLSSLGQGICLAYPTATLDKWLEKYPLLDVNLYTFLIPAGAILGTLFDVFINRVLGRKRTICSGASVSLICIAFLAMAARTKENIWGLYFGNLLMGIACGIVSHAAPAYLHEVSHHERRGKFGAGHSVAIAIGLSMTLMVGHKLHLGYMIIITFLPFILSAVLLTAAPYSPKWLTEVGRPEDEVKASLYKLHGVSLYSQQQLGYLTTHRLEPMSTKFMDPAIYKPFIVSVCLLAAQQATGINGFIERIYRLEETQSGLIAFGLAHIIGSLVTLLLIDRFSRSTLLHSSQAIQLMSLLTMAASWTANATQLLSDEHHTSLVRAAISVYIFGYSLGSGPVPWIMVNELLPTKTITYVTAAATSSSWLFDTIATRLFAFLLDRFGGVTTFIIFAVFAVVSVVFVKYCLPETAGLTLEELEEFLKRLYKSVFQNQPRTLSADSPSVQFSSMEDGSQENRGFEQQEENGEERKDE